MKPTDAFSATDRIEFRRVEIKYEWDTGRQFSAVEVVINGVELFAALATSNDSFCLTNACCRAWPGVGALGSLSSAAHARSRGGP